VASNDNEYTAGNEGKASTVQKYIN